MSTEKERKNSPLEFFAWLHKDGDLAAFINWIASIRDQFNIMRPRRRPYWNPKHQWRHRHRGGGFRKVRHYKDCLKDDYYYRDEANGYDITKPHVVEDPWVTEPGRNRSCCWKDQTRYRHQYEKYTNQYKSNKYNTIRGIEENEELQA